MSIVIFLCDDSRVIVHDVRSVVRTVDTLTVETDSKNSTFPADVEFVLL